MYVRTVSRVARVLYEAGSHQRARESELDRVPSNAGERVEHEHARPCQIRDASGRASNVCVLTVRAALSTFANVAAAARDVSRDRLGRDREPPFGVEADPVIKK